jgi:hypothetical protein
MKYSVEMASDGIVYIPSLIKIGLGIQVWQMAGLVLLMGGIYVCY